MHQQIETDRLSIRPLELNDASFIFDLLNSEGWLQFIGNRNISNIKDAEVYIQNILKTKHYYYSVFELKENPAPMGIITFLYRDTLEFPDIGFAMLPQFEKQGYALEAVKAYVDALIRSKLTPKILGITQPDNVNSARLLEKLGLVFEKISLEQGKPLHIYSMSF